MWLLTNALSNKKFKEAMPSLKPRFSPSCWNLFMDRISPLGRVTLYSFKYLAILFITFFALGNI